MAGRLHDRSHFFKYASLGTAMRVIESKSFRWSAPTKFNDPFDHQAGFEIKVDPSAFAKQLTESAERVICSDVAPCDPEGVFPRHLLLLLRANRDKFSPEELRDQLHEGALEMASSLEKDIAEKLNPQLLAFLWNARVFCVSEVNDNVVMWSHYADSHRGVVFKLGCIDAIDNALLAARKVTYTDKFFEFSSGERYAKHLTGEAPFEMTPLCSELSYVKHTDWAYEKEWRVYRPLPEPAGDGYALYPEDPRVFEAVYLGCRMPAPDVEAISAAIRRNLPDTRIFRAEQSRAAFALTFRDIDSV